MLYTLIGLALIGVVLAFVMPKINEAKDRLIIEQTITSLNDIDGKINEVLRVAGNTRIIGFTMKRGELTIDAASDKIIFEMKDSRVLYSEPGVDVAQGRIVIRTEEGSKTNLISLTISYNIDLQYDAKDEPRKFSQAATPYEFIISNEGVQDGREVVNINEVSGG